MMKDRIYHRNVSNPNHYVLMNIKAKNIKYQNKREKESFLWKC